MNDDLYIKKIYNRFENSASKLELNLDNLLQSNEMSLINLTKIYQATMIAYDLYDMLCNYEILTKYNNYLSKLNQIAEKIIQLSSSLNGNFDTYHLQLRLIMQRGLIKSYDIEIITIDENLSRDEIQKLLFMIINITCNACNFICFFNSKRIHNSSCFSKIFLLFHYAIFNFILRSTSIYTFASEAIYEDISNINDYFVWISFNQSC